MAVDGIQDAAVIGDELVHRAEIDQRARRACIPLFAKAVDGEVGPDNLTLEERALIDRLSEVDEDNTRWLQDLVQRRGWPTRSLVGEEGARAAWLLVQHGDHDPA